MDTAGNSTGSLSSRTLVSQFWLLSGSVLTSLLRIAVLAVLARLLAPADFGKFAAAMVVVGLAEIFTSLGVGPALIQRQELRREHVEAGLVISVLFGGVVGLIVALAAPLVAQFFNAPDIAAVVRLLAITFPVSGFRVVSEALLQREMRFRALVGVQFLSFVLGYCCVSIGLAVMGSGVWALALAYLAQILLAVLFLLGMRLHSLPARFDVAAARELLSLGSGFTALGAFNYLAVWGDYLVVGRWLGATALGYYSRAYTLMMMPTTLLGQVLSRTLFPGMSQIQGDKARLSKVYLEAVSVVSLIMLPTSVLSVMLGPEIVKVFLGPAWMEATAPFQILALGMFFRFGYKISSTVTQSLGAVYGNAMRQLVYAALVLSGAGLGSYWGLNGVAKGVLIALGVHYLLLSQLALSRLSIGWPTFWRAHGRGLIAAVAAGVSCWLLAGLLRDWQTADWLVLIAAPAAVLVAGVGLAQRWPGVVLGEAGVRLLSLMRSVLVDQSGWGSAIGNRGYE